MFVNGALISTHWVIKVLAAGLVPVFAYSDYSINGNCAALAHLLISIYETLKMKRKYQFEDVRTFNVEEVGQVFQKIYDSNIQFSFRWLRQEGVFDWRIGDMQNGFPPLPLSLLKLLDSDYLDLGNIEDCVSALAYGVALLYPESEFALWYNDWSEHIEILFSPN